MRAALSRAPLLLLTIAALVATAACQAGPTTPGGSPVGSPVATQVSPQQVGEDLMAALRDGNYAAAHAVLATGSARDYAADAAELQSDLEARGLTPESWSFEPIQYNVDEAGNDVLAGTVTFADGTTGTVEITLTALGLSANPWRVQDFSLRKS